MRCGAVVLGALSLVTLVNVSGCAAQVSKGHGEAKAANKANDSKHSQAILTAPDMEVTEGGRASDYLAMGVSFFHANHKAKAAKAFQHALATGNLNNQGRALAYWHLFLANREADVNGVGAEALDSFLTVSLLLFEEEHELPDVEAQSVREFIHGFNLAERMLLAELVLDALWARRDAHFGRSPQRAVKVRSADAERLFVQLFKPCGANDSTPTVQQEEITHLGVRVDQVSFSCPGEATSGQFFFSTR
jgi:hypothetical protein